MENPGARLHQIPNTRSQTGKLISTAFVGAVHVVAIWALVTGLAGKIVQSVPKVIEAKIIQTTPPKEKPPPPAPEAKLQTPPKIVQAYIPPPDIKVAAPPPPAPVQQVQRTTPPPPVIPAPIIAPAPAPPPPAVPTAPDSGPVGVALTHTIYPPAAVRLGKEGTPTLSVSISASGSVVDATVVSSSGDDELDQAAVQWVKEHWRYKPAIRNGEPAPGTVQAAVRFTLKNATG